MPTLHWVGKDKVVNHHHEVPFRVLIKVSTFSAPEGLPNNSTDNRIIHGDNLEALKSAVAGVRGPGEVHLHRPALQHRQRRLGLQR